MGALLALIPGKDLVYGALIVTLIAFGAYERHHLIAEGQQHELAALKLSSDRLQKKTDQQTAELQAKATMAERAYDKEHALVANQPIDSVRLCLSANRSRVVSQAGTLKSGAQSAGAAAGNIQSMPSGDSGSGPGVSGPDVGQLLSALSAAADRESAVVREFQNRE